MYDTPLTTEQNLSVLAATPSRLSDLTAPLPAAQLLVAPEPGEWSARDVLAHLRACAVWGRRIIEILAEDRPTFKAVNPTSWIKQTSYQADRAYREHPALVDNGRSRQLYRGRSQMPFYERGPVRIYYEEVGAGFPLLVIPGGGLNSSIASLASPFNPMERYRDDFRVVAADLRNANHGRSSGPIEVDRPWDAYADDQLGLMDHLRIDRFLVMGFCIGGPMIHNLIRRAPERVVAAAMMQPSGFRPEAPDLFYQNNVKSWGPALCAKRPDVTMDDVHAFLTSMYTDRADFVFTVSRDFVRSIQTPLLIAPDDVPAHPYAVAMEVATLAPNAEVTIYPWKDTPEHLEEVVEHARRFLEAHEPVAPRV